MAFFGITGVAGGQRARVFQGEATFFNNSQMNCATLSLSLCLFIDTAFDLFL